jgi:hypothetical protein
LVLALSPAWGALSAAGLKKIHDKVQARQRLDPALGLPQLPAKSRFRQLGYHQTLDHSSGNYRIVGQSRKNRVPFTLTKDLNPGGFLRVEVMLVNDTANAV